MQALEFPEIIQLKTNSICNLRCIHCPNTLIFKQGESIPLSMNFEIFKKIVDEVSENKSHLRIVNDGEPLIHKDILKQIDYVKMSKLKNISINTNGFFLNRVIDSLLKPSTVSFVIEVSLDAIYSNTYKQIRVNSNYTKVLENIFSFLNKRKQQKADNIFLNVSIVNHKINRNEINVFEKFWKPLVDNVVIRAYNNWNNKLPGQIRGEKNAECILPFNRLTLGPDAKVYYCIFDPKREGQIGDFSRNTISEIWNSNEYDELRQKHMNIINDKSSLKDTICHQCKMKKLMFHNRNYGTLIENTSRK